MDATSIQAGGEPAELKAPLPKVPRPAPEEQKTAEEPKEDHSAKQGPLPAPPLPNDPQNIQPIDYAPPAWSAKPPDTDKFTLEIVKDGIVAEVFDMNQRKNDTFITVGRVQPCDIVLQHPSVSRHHLILQYGTLNEGPGWYLYDMGSTHGSKLNKTALPKKFYKRMPVGSLFKVAGSSRLFVLAGPEEKETEDTPSVKGPAAPKPVTDVKAAEGKYYSKDPVGWLDKYFEREGLPMNFQFSSGEETSEWTCSLELPEDSSLTGTATTISATAIGKKEANLACALLACERLDAHDLLRDYVVKNARKTYAENDYYDSDEDTFFDRTGQIEEQRRKRRLRYEGLTENREKAETYESLSKALTEAQNKLAVIEEQLKSLMGKDKYAEGCGAPKNFSMRMAISQMRSKQKTTQAECDRLRKLMELVKPHTLDQMMPKVAKSVTQPKLETTAKMEPAQTSLAMKSQAESAEVLGRRKVEHDPSTPLATIVEPGKATTEEAKADEPSVKHEAEETFDQEDAAVVKGPALPSESQPGPSAVSEESADRTEAKPEKSEPKIYGLISKEQLRAHKRPRKERKRQVDADEALIKEGAGDYGKEAMEKPENYATWLPPQGQKGDGYSKLNEKFAGRY